MCKLEEGKTEEGRLPRDSSWPEEERSTGETSQTYTDVGDDPDCAAPSAPTDTNEDQALQCHLPEGSVYIWAALLDGADKSDAIVGWIVLLAQISSYAILILKAPKRSASELRRAAVVHHIVGYDDDYVPPEGFYNLNDSDVAFATYSPEEVSSGLSSIAVAMFLVLTFTAADLRGGWALLKTRKRYYVILGSAILLSFVMVVLASIKVLFFLSNDDVSFILGSAAVLFISDVDEKLWTALKTVDRSARIFWCLEAIFLSMVLSLFGVVWVGEPTATAPDGLRLSEASKLDFVTDLPQEVVFNWPFACLTAPLGATIGAWEVALVLQLVADRFDHYKARCSPRAKYWLAVEVLGLIDNVAALATGMFPGGIWCFGSWALSIAVFPSIFVAFRAVALVVPRCSKCDIRGVFKTMVGLSLGLAIAAGVRICSCTASKSEYLGGTMSAGDVIAHVALALFALTVWRYLFAAVPLSLAAPGEFNMLGLSFKQTMCAAAADTDSESTRLTVVGIMFFVVSMSTRVYFLWMLGFSITQEAVKL